MEYTRFGNSALVIDIHGPNAVGGIYNYYNLEHDELVPLWGDIPYPGKFGEGTTRPLEEGFAAFEELWLANDTCTDGRTSQDTMVPAFVGFFLRGESFPNGVMGPGHYWCASLPLRFASSEVRSGRWLSAPQYSSGEEAGKPDIRSLMQIGRQGVPNPAERAVRLFLREPSVAETLAFMRELVRNYQPLTYPT